jgi:pimeloyl-ACP methyl ester carboxylesterase
VSRTISTMLVMMAALGLVAGGGSLWAAQRLSTELLQPQPFVVAGVASDPRAAFGAPYSTVTVEGPLGAMPAWLVRGTGDTWVVVVHGLGAPRAEALPVMRIAWRLHLPALAISYRNDPDAPPSDDGLVHLGAEEWRDLEAAVRFAQQHGAHHVVLVGYSMGATIVCEFMRQSPLRSLAVAAVLDSPVLDWKGTLEQLAERRGLPGPITRLAERLIERRIGVDLGALDEVRSHGWLRVPTLIFEGRQDTTVPIGDGLRLAAARPRLVHLVLLPHAHHADGWQSDPARYRATVRRLLLMAATPPGHG